MRSRIRPQRRGLTLVEVIAALVLLGTLVVSTLLAFSRHRRQLRAADDRLQAVAIADEILPKLMAESNGLTVGQRGTIAGRPDWFWQTSLVGTTVVATLPMHVIRFEIRSKTNPERLLTRIEMVRPQPQGP
ncbi:MAG: prepilin-type N-terminal cleavage/methylation domain-containing protein [Planctomycetota bacterium]